MESLIIFFIFCFNHVSSQPKILDLFPVQNYDSIQSFNMGRYLGNKIPDNYVLKYFDHVANTYNLNLFNGNKKSYYSIARISIGSCDFSLKPYSYASKRDLSNFSIEKDKQYIIPLLKFQIKRIPKQ